MEESELIQKNGTEAPKGYDFHGAVRICGTIWKVSKDGKFWIIKTSKDLSAASEKLLRREYEISRNFQHPFILTPVGFEDRTPFGPAIVMEYIDGRDLAKFIEERPSVALRKKILYQLLDAVGYLHNRGVLHNDIKAENIIVTSIGNNVKLIDFNLAEVSGDYLNRRLGGTRGISAPEVMEGNVALPSTAASDIFSLGGMISMLFPGRYLTVVKKCHRSDPAKRYQDVQSLENAIRLHSYIPLIIVALICVIIALVLLIRKPVVSVAMPDIPMQEAVENPTKLPSPESNPADKKQEQSVSEKTSRGEERQSAGPSLSDKRQVSMETEHPFAVPDKRPASMETEHPSSEASMAEIEKSKAEILMQESSRRAASRRQDSIERTRRICEGNISEAQALAWKIYEQSADSLDDFNLVPCQEFAYAVITNYERRMKSLSEELGVNAAALDEDYSYGLNKLYSRVFRMLTLNDLLLLGTITEEERDRMQKLIDAQRPFSQDK